jgi:hypothetical protein
MGKRLVNPTGLKSVSTSCARSSSLSPIREAVLNTRLKSLYPKTNTWGRRAGTGVIDHDRLVAVAFGGSILSGGEVRDRASSDR